MSDHSSPQAVGAHGGAVQPLWCQSGLSLAPDGSLDKAHWAREYPDCGGRRQSPINVQRKKVRYNPKLQPLKLKGYEVQEGAFSMTNNGHTGELQLEPRESAKGAAHPICLKSRGSGHGGRTLGFHHQGRDCWPSRGVVLSSHRVAKGS